MKLLLSTIILFYSLNSQKVSSEVPNLTLGNKMSLLDGANEKLTVKSLNHKLLNKTVFQLINEKRKKKGLDTLAFTTPLNEVAIKYQDELEFRRFKNTVSIERKINKSLYARTKKAGFDGGLVLPIVGEFNALDYDGKEFFLDKTNKDSTFKLFYGKKPRKSEKNPVRTEIEALDYYSFAKKVLKELESENKKQLYSKVYKWGGLHLQWHYKSLNKRKIPQIKMVFLLGGYATAGMRL